MAAAFSVANVSGIADAGSDTYESGDIVIAAGSVVYVEVISSDSTPVDPSGVVWDAVGVNESLTQLVTTIDHGTYAKASCWRIISPTAKTAKFKATWPSNQGERMLSVWAGTGIDTTTPNGTVVQNSGTAATATTGAITSTVGQLILAMGAQLDIGGTAETFDSPTGTERAEGATSGTAFDAAASQDFVATGTSTTLTWTFAGSFVSWAMFGIPLNDAAGGGGTTRGAPFGSRGNAFNGGRTFNGIIR